MDWSNFVSGWLLVGSAYWTSSSCGLAVELERRGFQLRRWISWVSHHLLLYLNIFIFDADHGDKGNSADVGM